MSPTPSKWLDDSGHEIYIDSMPNQPSSRVRGAFDAAVDLAEDGVPIVIVFGAGVFDIDWSTALPHTASREASFVFDNQVATNVVVKGQGRGVTTLRLGTQITGDPYSMFAIDGSTASRIVIQDLTIDLDNTTLSHTQTSVTDVWTDVPAVVFKHNTTTTDGRGTQTTVTQETADRPDVLVSTDYAAGSTTAGIEEALTAAGANGAVFIPPGTHLVTNDISFQAAGQRLYGAGPEASIIQYNEQYAGGGSGWIIDGNGQADCQIADFQVDVNDRTHSHSSILAGVNLDGVRNSGINVTVRDTNTHAFDCDGDELRMERCVAKGFENAGLFTGLGTRQTWIACEAYGDFDSHTADAGIDLNLTENAFIGCYVERCTRGADIDQTAAARCMIANCTINDDGSNIATHGIDFLSTNVNGVCLIIGNVVVGNSQASSIGILAKHVGNALVVGNHVAQWDDGIEWDNTGSVGGTMVGNHLLPAGGFNDLVITTQQPEDVIEGFHRKTGGDFTTGELPNMHVGYRQDGGANATGSFQFNDGGTIRIVSADA